MGSAARGLSLHTGPSGNHGPECRTRGSPGNRARPKPAIHSPSGRTRPLEPRRSRGGAAPPGTEPSASGAEDGRGCPGSRANDAWWLDADEAGFVAWEPTSVGAPWRRLESTVGRRHGRSGHPTVPRDRIKASQSARCPARAIFGARGAEPRKVREAPDPFEPGSSDGTASAARFSTSPSRTLDRHLDPQRPFVCPLGPFLGPFDPAASDIASRQEPQIVRPTKGLWGFLLRFGTSRVSLISVRSVVQIYPGPLNPVWSR